MRNALLAFLAALSFGGAASAEVVDKGSYGFRLKYTAKVAASPEKVFRAIGEIDRWWSPAHTYSGQASNLSMPLAANACYCEALPGGGGVRHGVVELVIPNKQVRVAAALGPLQDEGVGAAWAFDLKPNAGGTEVVMTYNVAGARDFVTTLAPAADGVMGEGFRRFARYVETGKPE
ncbi:SRPBCC family protein [Phenylobacterium sp. J426]|uniref:SRPBCC family protein n=1 Tax=Phenylobacterium sp. J426 TaxID=2898439 RepID=UPI002150E92A|nr:SRPBCC family protein [Phenylobacterium sp. J426]MCR5873787.1 SRPBCC family protein [Phenylobacterium sp. J426]